MINKSINNNIISIIHRKLMHTVNATAACCCMQAYRYGYIYMHYAYQRRT